MRYQLIPLEDTVPNLSVIPPVPRTPELGDEQRAALARAFERGIQTAELLVTYAVWVAGKPSKQ